VGDLLEIVDVKIDQVNAKLTEHKKSDSIDLKQLINRLNYINFQDGTLTSVFQHKNYNRSISLNTKPKACIDSQLSCFWSDQEKNNKEISNYNLKKIYIDDGIRTIVINPENVNYEDEGFTIDLPEVNILKPPRRTRRFPVFKINVQMIQNGVLYRGKLINFTPDSFKIEIPSESVHSINTFNPDASVSITLLKNQQIIFSGQCSLIRTSKENKSIFCILKPENNQIKRFKTKEYRSFRQKLLPSPNIVFIHPITGARVDLPVYDLSGAGFSVEEDQRTSILLPGMIIPNLEVVLSPGMKVNCKCQVLYRKKSSEEHHRTIILTGFVIIDMEPYDHVQLLSIIFLAKNKNLHLSKDLDPNALWRFLFESGFIYPSKYAYLKEHKEEIKSSYNKIYTNAPDIARHVTYQDKGEILGHMSMLRTYENTWLMHHHAASNTSNMGAGLYVMDQLSNYAYNANKIESLHLDYLMCYYRPENRFPAKIFGGAEKSVNNKKGCSINNFVFFRYQGNSEIVFDDLGSFSLEESDNEDLLNLESYYEEVSGGLMLKAMNLIPGENSCNSVIKAYEKLQFKRGIKLYSLKSNGELLAVFIADMTDTGLNMSELTNNIKVIIMQPEKLTKETLDISINEIAKVHYNNSTYVLLFPDSYADNNSMAYEKKYSMWIMNLEYSDLYFKYLKKLMRFIKS